jgi:hypothetical protein
MTVTENSTTQPKLLQMQWEKNAQKYTISCITSVPIQTKKSLTQ